MLQVMNPLDTAGSRLGFSFGVRARTEMERRCVMDMYRLKLVSSENNQGLKGLNRQI